MTNEATVLVVEAGPLPEDFVAHLEAAGLFVEVVVPSDLSSAYTVVAPDLVVHVGAAHAEMTVRFLKHEHHRRPTRLVLVGSRAELTALRSLDRSVVQSVLALDIPEKLIVDRIVSLGVRAVSAGADARKVEGAPGQTASATFASAAEEKIRVWVQSSRPPVISEKDEADEELDAPEEFGYDFSPYVGVTPPSDEPEPSRPSADQPEYFPPNDEPELLRASGEPAEPDALLPDEREDVPLASPSPDDVRPSEIQSVSPGAQDELLPTLVDLEDDDRDTVVIERSLAAILDAQHEKTPAFPAPVSEGGKLADEVKERLERPNGLVTVAAGNLPPSPQVPAPKARPTSLFWGAALILPVSALSWWLLRSEPSAGSSPEIASTVEPVLNDSARSKPDSPGSEPSEATSEPRRSEPVEEPRPAQPLAAPQAPELTKSQTSDLWRVPENPSVPSCETLIPNPSHLRLGDGDQGSRLWKQARGYLLLGNMKSAHVALCEASLVSPSGLVAEALIEHLLTLGAPQRAEPLMVRALKARPERPKTLELAGDVECQLGHPERALELWLKALGLTNPSPATLKQIARQLVAQAAPVLKGGQIALADRLYRRAAILDAGQTAAWIGLAEIAEQRGASAQALAFRAAAAPK